MAGTGPGTRDGQAVQNRLTPDQQQIAGKPYGQIGQEWLDMVILSLRVWSADQDWRAIASSVGMATTLALWYMTVALWSVTFVLGTVAASFTWAISRKHETHSIFRAAAATVPLAWVIAALGAGVWGFGLQTRSVLLVVWWASMVLFILVEHRALTMNMLIPVWLVEALMTMREGIIGPQTRAYTFGDSPNVAGGFLALGIVYLMTTKHRAWAIFLMVGLAFTGSRWATIVLAAILLGMLAARTVPWRNWLAIVLVAFLICLPFAGTVSKAYRVHPIFTPPESVEEAVTRHVEKARQDIMTRVTWTPEEHIAKEPDFNWRRDARWMMVAPMGFMGANGVHSVPERMLYELGAVPTAIWFLVSLWALSVGPRRDWSWWMLMTFMGLTLLDYYSWMPFTVSAFWWILVGYRAQQYWAERRGMLQCANLIEKVVDGNNGVC